MKVMRLLFLGLALIGLSGCGLQNVNLKPEMNTANVKAAKSGTVITEKEFNFKGCSATDEQKQLVLSVQAKIAGLYDKLLNNKISLKKYNKRVKAATNALDDVELACAAKDKASSAAKPDKKDIAKATANMENAWKNLKRVEQKL